MTSQSLFWFLLLIGLVVGCSNQTVVTHNLSAPQLHSKLQQIQQWDVQGKLAIYTNNNSYSGLLSWRQRLNSFDLLLSNPFGSHKLHIVGSDGLITATDNQGQISDTSATRLFEQQFGWSFPLDYLTYWVTGLPGPDSHAVVDYNQQRQITRIMQAGWVVDYKQLRPVDGLLMPYKIQITGSNIRLVLILKNWHNLVPLSS